MRFFLLFFFAGGVFCQRHDPSDPTSHRKVSKPDDNVCQSNPDPTLRHVIRGIFYSLGVDTSLKAGFSRSAKLSLSDHNVAIISDYLSSAQETPEIREKVRNSFENFIQLIDEEDYLLSLLKPLYPWLIIGNVFILVPSTILFLKSIMRARSFWFTMLTLFFFFSMLTTYNRMYQEKLADRFMKSMTLQDSCASKGLIEQGLDVISGLFILKGKSDCQQYIESQTVSIIAEISIMDVFSDVLSHSIFGFFANMGVHINKFYRNLFKDIPFQHMIVMLAFSLVILIAIFSLFIRVRLPFVTLDPIFLPFVEKVLLGERTETQPIEQAPRPTQQLLESNSAPAAIEDTTSTSSTSQRTKNLRHRQRKSDRKQEERDDSIHSTSSIDRSRSRDRRPQREVSP